MWSVSYITCIDLTDQVSLTRRSSFFLDVLTLKLRIIIILLPTDRPETILPVARTTKHYVAFTLTHLTPILHFDKP